MSKRRVSVSVRFWAVVIALLLVCLVSAALSVAHAATAPPPLAIPIAAGPGWSTDVSLRNTSSESVTQVFQRRTILQPPFDPRVVEDAITLAPGETRWILNAGKTFDAGFWIVQLDPRVEGSAFIRSPTTAFEVLGIRPLAKVGDAQDFYRVVVNPPMDLGTFPVVMNTGAKTFVEVMVLGPVGERLDDKQIPAPAGISQFAVSAYAPTGATLHICLGGCAIGAGVNGPPVYVFAAVGSALAGTPIIRHGVVGGQ